MVTIATVKNILSNQFVEVTIPIFDGNENSAGYNPNLTKAKICAPYGNYPQIKIDDKVIVAFYNGFKENPVIIGQFFNMDKSNYVDEVLNSLEVKGQVILPYNTTIGDVSMKDISYLKGINSNLQYQLDVLSKRLDALENKSFTNPEFQVVGFTGVYDGEYHSVQVYSTKVDSITYSTDGVTFVVENPKFKEIGNNIVYVKGTYQGNELVKNEFVKITNDEQSYEWGKISNIISSYDGNPHSITVTGAY